MANSAFSSVSHRRRVSIFIAVAGFVALAACLGILLWNNPMPFASEGWWLVARMRGKSIAVIAVVAVCQAVATVSFQTATQNRIITPSIMGFEALYTLVQTSLVFFLGISGISVIDGAPAFLLQTLIMVGFAVGLYMWLLSGRLGNLHIMLLVGIILGSGLGALSQFMQRIMDPSTFDVLTARLFGNISNADTTNLTITVPIVGVTAGIIVLRSRVLNVLSLGRETATNLGINHKRQLMITLFLVSILMAMTTSLVGPMTFFGFLVATLAYSLTDTYDHRVIFPAAMVLGFAVLSSAYFILRHVFYAGGAVTVIIELVGGLAFLIVVMRKGRL
ncbi:iron chelate uptake ABC transporter family permease subunit [Cutibacterium sp.]|uniref:iron chelate uptake ABC transporter family permease subunit n=1 Tax=Cutibacterium sp. TaxID=1912221 RepID=UPI0026DC1C7F|nr:iron chelate uptake ABC transporter family permease subunit [Cutibacterium sp.]MDO4412411.1 iron chelate uptake ABC transporter family permease subunit [Cutibacterium sp.]